INRINEGLGMASQNSQALSQMAGKASQGIEDIGRNTRLMGLQAASENLNNLGQDFVAFGANILNTQADVAHGIMANAAIFQDAEASMRFAFGESNWENMFEKTKQEAAKLTFT